MYTDSIDNRRIINWVFAGLEVEEVTKFEIVVNKDWKFDEMKGAIIRRLKSDFPNEK